MERMDASDVRRHPPRAVDGARRDHPAEGSVRTRSEARRSRSSAVSRAAGARRAITPAAGAGRTAFPLQHLGERAGARRYAGSPHASAVLQRPHRDICARRCRCFTSLPQRSARTAAGPTVSRADANANAHRLHNAMNVSTRRRSTSAVRPHSDAGRECRATVLTPAKKEAGSTSTSNGVVSVVSSA